jgi:hypothetical protein
MLSTLFAKQPGMYPFYPKTELASSRDRTRPPCSRGRFPDRGPFSNFQLDRTEIATPNALNRLPLPNPNVNTNFLIALPLATNLKMLYTLRTGVCETVTSNWLQNVLQVSGLPAVFRDISVTV